MTATRDELIAKIWDNADPFSAVPLLAWDCKGYTTSHHYYLTEAIETLRPRIIVEVGVYKGASVLVMAGRARELGLDCAIIAIDTWLGSAEHMTGVRTKIGFPRRHGYPQVYFTFLSNVVHYKVVDYVVPLPLDSANCCEVLKHHGIVADLIHIDAGHDYRSVKTDLETWWPMLREGGILLGDDYYTEGPHWQGVRKAFDEFFGSKIEHEGGKCRIHKAAGISN